ncbi:MAG: hypothetical protein HY774_19755 [Acidobacteria bacterium]|nr:hypothetical protein [Acidobacteriota bacterium]
MATNSGFSIKQETLARRCEICHQSDSFIPETNHCFRCDGVPTSLKPSPAAVIPVETPMFLRRYADSEQQAYEIFSERFVMAAISPYIIYILGVIVRELRFSQDPGEMFFQLATGLFFVLPGIGMVFALDAAVYQRSLRAFFLGTLIASGPIILFFLLRFIVTLSVSSNSSDLEGEVCICLSGWVGEVFSIF